MRNVHQRSFRRFDDGLGGVFAADARRHDVRAWADATTRQAGEGEAGEQSGRVEIPEPEEARQASIPAVIASIAEALRGAGIPHGLPSLYAVRDRHDTEVILVVAEDGADAVRLCVADGGFEWAAKSASVLRVHRSMAEPRGVIDVLTTAEGAASGRIRGGYTVVERRTG